MSMSLHSAIPGQCCDFSMGPEGKATFESLSVNLYLWDRLNVLYGHG